MNKHILMDFIKEKVKISYREEQVLTNNFTYITKKRNEFLIHEGSNCSYLYFIVDGCLRCFYNDDDGNEITVQFYTAKEFVTSFNGFLNKIPSKENIQCITDATLLRISKSEYDTLYNEISNWSVFCKSVYEDYIMKVSDRVNSLQTLSASERYLKFLNAQPNIVQNAAVKHLASYLGIKPQSLSRIRQEAIK